MSWASTPTSAILIAHGKRAASRTPTDGFAASFRAKPTCANVPFDRYNSSPAAIMPRRGSAWDTKPPPSCSPFTCCTSNVNPPIGLRRHDVVGLAGGSIISVPGITAGDRRLAGVRVHRLVRRGGRGVAGQRSIVPDAAGKDVRVPGKRNSSHTGGGFVAVIGLPSAQFAARAFSLIQSRRRRAPAP